MKCKISLSLIFLFFNLFLAFSVFPQSTSRENDEADQFLNLIKKNKSGSASLSMLDTESSVQEYFRTLSTTDKREYVSGLGIGERLRLFENLNDNDRQDLFFLLTDKERKELFEQLSDSDKRKIFNSLNDDGKKSLFKLLEDNDRQFILSGLNHLERISLIEDLPEDEKIKALSGFSAIIEEEETQLSNIEKILSGQFPEIDEKPLLQFGYDFFEKRGFLAPEIAVPAGPDYIIGPNDSFTIHLWGRTEETHNNVIVSRDGTITLPRLGTMDVGGLTQSEFKDFLLKKFKEYYPDFEMSITMNALRTVEVFIIGEMKEPGTYSLNALSTVISALFASGGPSKNGTLRNIKVLNNGNLVKTIDLYDFFIKGGKGDDIRLQQGYTIFIPVVGPVVGIAGNVKRPAIYELKGEQTLGDIIDMAGGILPSGHLQNVVIERLMGHKRRIVNSFDLDPENDRSIANLKTVLRDGDHIKIYPIYKEMQKVVYLEGHVKYPREYELKEGMRLLDILPSFDSLLPEPYLPQAEIIRLVPPDLHPEIVGFNLGALLSGDNEQNLLLHDRDRVIVYSEADKRDIPEVMINGAIREPGVYRLYKGMTVKDLIFQAGNLTKSASMEKGDLTRLVSSSNGTDIIKMGFVPKKAISGNAADNLVLQEDDQVFIREIPKYNNALDRKVTLQGEFMFPGEYTFAEGERLSSVIERAGGLTKEAYPFGAVFLRESVKEIQKERLSEYVSKLERDILSISALSAESALDSGQASILMQTLNAKKELIQKLRSAEPTGRMIINISEILLMSSTDANIELRPGDRLIIGKRPDTVHVMGEVYNPNALLAEEGMDVEHYLSLVGGPTENADKKQIYIVKADGTVVSKRQEKFGLFNWDSTKQRWAFGSFDSIELIPGDTIIVPERLIKLSWLKLFRDTTNVLYQIAVSAGVLVEIFKD